MIQLLEEKGGEDIVVFGRGIVPEKDIPALKQCGVKAIFPPGTTTGEAVKWVRQNIRR